MALLAWRDANFRDRRALQLFKCTEHGLTRRMGLLGSTLCHPRMYEYQIQELVQRAKPPLGKKYLMRVGFDDQGLAAVATSESLDPGRLYELSYVAIAWRLRDSKLGYADEMINDTLEVIAAHSLAFNAEKHIESTEIEVVACRCRLKTEQM